MPSTPPEAGRPAYRPLVPAPPPDRVIRKGWRLSGGPAVPLKPPIDWTLPDTASRSWGYHLYALDLLEPLLIRYAERGDGADLNLARDIALDWVERGRGAELPQDLVWYDMAVGLRAWRLAWLSRSLRLRPDAASRRGAERLDAVLDEHARRLAAPETFAHWSNHGFFQTAGLLALAGWGRTPDPEARRLGLERLRAILTAHFTEDGVHKEHSPDYALFVLDGLRALADAGLADEADLRARIDRIDRTLAWFVKPDGRLVNFGDSDNRRVGDPRLLERRRDGLATFHEGGYAVLRNGPSYLAQALGFHGRMHKQADDLSLVWTDRGQDILIDAGRFAYGARAEQTSPLWRQGFRYADPRRIHCESTGAHNTVEIDELSHSRRHAYGSALKDAGESGGIAWILSGVSRPEGRHDRLIVARPGDWLCVVDGLRGPWLGRRTHRQWHHLDPAWTLSRLGNDVVASAEGQSDLRIVSLTGHEVEGPYLGAETPRLMGWRSPSANRLEPAPAMAHVSAGPSRVVMATLFVFADRGPAGGTCRMTSALTGTLTLDIGGKRLSIRRDRRGVGIIDGSA